MSRVRRLLLDSALEIAVILLLIATFVAVRYEDALLGRTIVFTPRNIEARSAYWYADKAVGGGSEISADGTRPFQWQCVLKGPYQYPYCGYGVLLDPEGGHNGLDLSRYRELAIEISYAGPANSLRVHLKNNDPRYSKPGVPESDKFNQADFPVKDGRQRVRLPLSGFTVAEWWLTTNKIAPELSRPEFDNIVALELQTGAGSELGRHRFQVSSIILKGAVLTQFEWYAAISLCWLLLISGILVHRRKQARKVQKALADGWRRTLDNIPQMVWSATSGGEEYFNEQWTEFTGKAVGGSSGVHRIDLLHPEDRAAAAARWERSLATGEAYEAEYRMLHRSGEHRWVLSRGFPERNANGEVVRWYGTCTDIHERVLATHALDASESLNRGIIDAIPDCVSLLDLNGTCVFANKATLQTYRVDDPGKLLGQHLLTGLPARVRPQAEAALAQAQNGQIARLLVRGEGSRWWDSLIAPVFDKSGTPLRLVVVSRDITDQKMAEEKAQWSANHDSLTGLPNRLVLQKRIDQAIEEAAGTGDRFALLLLDVDDFKKINDTAGHDAGDALLCAFAERLGAAVRPEDTVARLGGDEFGVLLAGVACEQGVRTAVEGIFDELRKPCLHGGRVFDCNASIGATIYRQHGADRVELLKNADVALYAAKSAGKGKFQIFRSAMRNEMQRRSSMVALARDALQHGRVTPHYQPKIELQSRRVDGFEALLRWRHPKKGMQVPGLIAAAFDDLSLAGEISDRMIESVIRDIQQWREQGIAFGHVAINAAAAEFRRDDFADRLLERLHAGSIPAEAMQLEVTETVFLGRGAECVERALKTLSAAGVQIALDDFGTGYASLSHLKQFPVDILKIDRSFVRDVEEQPDNAPIIDAVINLARSLGIEVVAEGIETSAQHDFLVARGCHYGQGYLYSPAVPAEDAGHLVKTFTEAFRAAA